MTKEDLIAFEEDIKSIHITGAIKAPVHLAGGNEDELIELFQRIAPQDWVFSTHRSHYHALLKGVPPAWLKKEILEGRSIGIYNAEHHFYSSAIVGGCLPIAVGVAMADLRLHDWRERENVWVFVGDMAAETGIFHECTKYAGRHGIPVHFVVEDNGLSVNTPTREVWGQLDQSADVIRCVAPRKFPHQGTGTWVVF